MKILVTALSVILSIFTSSLAFSLIHAHQSSFFYKIILGFVVIITPVFVILQAILSYRKKPDKKGGGK